MDAAHAIPAVLCAAERASHLALAAHNLLLLSLPPEAVREVGRIVGVIYLDACEGSETLAEMIDSDPASARQGPPIV